MKNILNWTIGSFFRTFGRIIAYICIGVLVILLGIKFDIKGLLFTRLNALVNDNNKITYNYINNFVINNKDNLFFDSTGYLEQIRKSLINANLNNAKYLIGFTENDIIVLIDYNVNSEFYMFSEVYNTFDRILINSNTISGMTSTNSSKYYYKLSDYNNNVNNFINGILTIDNKKNEYDYYNYYRLAYTTNIDLRNRNYNWFDYNKSYFIPYYTNTNLKNNCYGSGCTYSDIQNIPFIINGVSEYIPTYYNLYGNTIPNNSLVPTSFKVYKEFFTINTSDLSSNWTLTTNFHYLLNNNNSLDHIDIYGLVNNNGIYHYENISNLFTITGYTFNCDSGVKSCYLLLNNNNISYSGNLSNYSKIYFDFVFSNFISIEKGSFSFNRSISGIIDVGINDISNDTLYLTLESSSINTYTFTTNDFNNTQFFYNNVPTNDFLYNAPSYVDLVNNIINDDVTYNTSTYYYDNFNQILFNGNILTNTNGLIMNLYNNSLDTIYNYSGSFQIIYYITPNLYWTISEYSSSRNSVCTDYLDNNNVVSTCISGDFNNHLSEHSNVENYFNIIKGIMSDDMYGLSGLINTPLEKIKNLTNSTCSSIILPVPFTNTSITIPCMSTIYETYIPSIFTIWKIVVAGLVSYYIGVGIFRDIKNTLESDKNDIEVIEL